MNPEELDHKKIVKHILNQPNVKKLIKDILEGKRKEGIVCGRSDWKELE